MPAPAARYASSAQARGAGMIHPQLGPPHATMLVYLFTDLVAEPAELQSLLQPAVERSFNSISIDGDTSTNDTVLLIASGASGVALDPGIRDAFANAVTLVCESLAFKIVDDGEGVTHVVTLHITGARDAAEAKKGRQVHRPLPPVQDRLVPAATPTGDG